MSVRTFRDAIVTTLRSRIPELVSVEAHDGNFDLTEIQRHFGHHPRAARVVCPGVANVEDHGGADVITARWVVFIAAREQNVGDPDGKMSHGDACMLLAERVMAVVHSERWGCNGYTQATGIVAQNLYTGALDKRGLSLWVVEWQQGLELDDSAADELPPLRVIHTDYDLSDVHEGPDSSTTTIFE